MRRWTLAPSRGARCGYAWCLIGEGVPMQVIESPSIRKARYRCEQHAVGAVDWDQIHREVAERQALAAPGQETAPPVHRSMTPIAVMQTPFDFKTAAAGRDE